MGIAWRQSPGPRHHQRPLTTRKKQDPRPGHIPTPPRPRPDRARPALPQELAATFFAPPIIPVTRTNGALAHQPSATASPHGWNISVAPLLVLPSRSTTLGQANFIGRV